MLERYLWPHFTADAPWQHVLCIVLVVNEKFVSADRPWRTFEESPALFGALFARVRALCLGAEKGCGMREHASLLLFLIRCFQSVVRCLKGW